jgi:hypothetical protein
LSQDFERRQMSLCAASKRLKTPQVKGGIFSPANGSNVLDISTYVRSDRDARVNSGSWEPNRGSTVPPKPFGSSCTSDLHGIEAGEHPFGCVTVDQKGFA